MTQGMVSANRLRKAIRATGSESAEETLAAIYQLIFTIIDATFDAPGNHIIHIIISPMNISYHLVDGW